MSAVCYSSLHTGNKYITLHNRKHILLSAMMTMLTMKVTMIIILSTIPYYHFIICPISISYSTGQIIKSVCVCLSVCLCVCPCVVTLTVAFLCQFSPNLTQMCKLPKVRTSSLGVNIAPPLPLFYP